MAREGKQPESDEAPGAPEWMVTFSDCMTLLLTFFVLLLSFSSFEDKTYRKLQMIFPEDLFAIGMSGKRNKDSVLSPDPIQMTVDLRKGSEKPTLHGGLKDSLRKETPVDFRRRKVFSISSERIFFGNGVLLSPEGKRIMTTMASFLKEVPSHVVISENGYAGDTGQLGLSRAWAVMEYLRSSKGLDKKWFNVSAGRTLAQGALQDDVSSRTSRKSERTLEIVLLRSIYD